MNEQQKQKIQNQLRQFLKDYRKITNLSAEKTAKILGVEIATYRILEGKKPANRVISVLDYLKKMADLNKMALSDFINYLEMTDQSTQGSKNIKNGLSKWEHDLLDKFACLNIPLRNQFMTSLMKKTKEEVDEIITCITQIVSLSESKRRALFTLIKEMGPNTDDSKLNR